MLITLVTNFSLIFAVICLVHAIHSSFFPRHSGRHQGALGPKRHLPHSQGDHTLEGMWTYK